MALVLSQNTEIGPSREGVTLSSPRNFHNHTASFAASDAAMYSTLYAESAIVACLELFKQIVPPFRINTNPNTLLLSSLSD